MLQARCHGSARHASSIPWGCYNTSTALQVRCRCTAGALCPATWTRFATRQPRVRDAPRGPYRPTPSSFLDPPFLLWSRQSPASPYHPERPPTLRGYPAPRAVRRAFRANSTRKPLTASQSDPPAHDNQRLRSLRPSAPLSGWRLRRLCFCLIHELLEVGRQPILPHKQVTARNGMGGRRAA